MKPIKIAIVGATGVVGRKFLEVLEQRKIPVEKLVLFASEKSVGIQLPYQDKMYPVVALTEKNIWSSAGDLI